MYSVIINSLTSAVLELLARFSATQHELITVEFWDVLLVSLAVLGAVALERGHRFPQLVPGRARQVPRDGGHDGWAPGVVDGVGGVRRGWRDGVLPTGS